MFAFRHLPFYEAENTQQRETMVLWVSIRLEAYLDLIFEQIRTNKCILTVSLRCVIEDKMSVSQKIGVKPPKPRVRAEVMSWRRHISEPA